MTVAERNILLQAEYTTLKGLLRSHASVISRDSWCRSPFFLRFTTPALRKIFPPTRRGSGLLRSGECAFYEVRSDENVLNVEVTVDENAAKTYREKNLQMMLRRGNGDYDESRHLYFFYPLQLSDNPEELCARHELLDKWFADFFPFSETLLELVAENPHFEPVTMESMLRQIAERGKKAPREEDAEALSFHKIMEDAEPYYREGAPEEALVQRYERDPRVRRACLQRRGTVCAVCGFDFAKVWGEEFREKVEVHHKVPLSELAAARSTNPLEDVVPVCPNCHAMLHSRPGGGTYTVEELRALLKAREKETYRG